MKHYIYKIVRRDTGHFYIGIASTKGDPSNRAYMGGGLSIREAISEHGRAAFDKQVLVISTREMCSLYEELLVTEELLADPLCLNRTLGGDRGRFSRTHRMALAASNLGTKLTNEQRTALSQAQRGNKKPERTPEHRAALAEALRGKQPSPQAREKMRQAQLGKTQSEATKAKRKATWAAKRALNR